MHREGTARDAEHLHAARASPALPPVHLDKMTWALILVQGLDIVTTLRNLSAGGTEFNPFPAAMLQPSGQLPPDLLLYLAVSTKLLLAVVMIWVWRLAMGTEDRRARLFTRGAYGAFLVWMALVVVFNASGGAVAISAPPDYDQEIDGAWIEPGLNEFTPVTHVNGTTYAAFFNNGTEGMWLGVSHDSGATWNTSKIHSDDAGGASWAIAAADGRVVVAWNVHTAGTKRVVAYTDDLGGNWTWANHTMPAGNVQKHHIYAESDTTWYHGFVHMSPSAPHTLRTYIYKTTDAGASWTQHGSTLTWSSSVSGAFGAQGSSVFIHAPDRVVSAVAYTTDSTANSVNTAAWDGSSWSTNQEYGTCCSFEPGRSWITTDGTRVLALVGIDAALGSPNAQFLARDTFGVGSWDRTQAVTNQFTFNVDESGLWISSETTWIHVGERRDTTAIQYSYSDDAFATYTEHDLLETNDDAWAGPNADGTPMFTVGARFYSSPSWYDYVGPEQEATGSNWINVDYSYENNQNPDFYTILNTTQVDKWSTDLFSVQQSETPCQDEGLTAPGALGLMGITVDDKVIIQCYNDNGAQSGKKEVIHGPLGTWRWTRGATDAGNTLFQIEGYTWDMFATADTDGECMALVNSRNTFDDERFWCGTNINDLDIDRSGTGITVFTDDDGTHARNWTGAENITGQTVWDNLDFVPDAVAVHGTVWVADNLELKQLHLLNGTVLQTVTVPSASTGLRFSKDGQYLLRTDTQRAWVHNATTGAVVLRTDELTGIDDFDADLLNNWLVVLERNTDTLRLYAIYPSTTNAEGSGGTGPNPNLGTSPYEGQENATGSGGSGSGSGTVDPDSLFGQVVQPTSLANSMGISEDAAKWFLGLLLIVAMTAGLWSATQSGVAAGVGGLAGMGMAVAWGLIPLYIPILLGVGAVAVIVSRSR